MQFILFRRDLAGKFYAEKTFQSYRGAVKYGQEKCGKGKFRIDGPEGYTPTREEQLLETMKRPDRIYKSQREKKVTDEIAKLRRAIEQEFGKRDFGDE